MRFDRGSLSLELAFMIPVLIIVVVSSIFLGYANINKAALLDASFIGSQSSAYFGTDCQEVREDIYAQLQTRFIGDPDNVDVTIAYEDIFGGAYEETQKASDTIPTSPVVAAPGSQITVTLVFDNYVLDLPFVSTRTFDMTAVSVARNANP